MKLGVFFCTCNNTVDIDFRNVKKSIKKEVEVVEVNDQLCQGGLDYIIDDLRRFDLDCIIIAGCTEKKRIFDRVISSFDCDSFVLNLREHCGWVHGRKEATEKAKCMIAATISSVAMHDSYPRPDKIAVDAGYDVIVAGKEDDRALDVAKSLSNVANVHLVTNTVREWCDELELHSGSIKDVRGEIGAFEVEIERDIDRAKCIACGLCAEACPKNVIQYDAIYTIGEGCDECGDCVKVCPTGAIAFHSREVIHAGHVLVIDKEWEGPTQFGIYRAENYEDALKKALDVVSNLGEIEKAKYLSLDLRRCASGRSELLGCELCLSCPYGAVTREGVKMRFSDVGCQGCGLCTSLCPLSVPQLRGHPSQLLYAQIDGLLAEDLHPKVLLFACQEHVEKLNEVGRKKIQYPGVLPLFVPCTDVVSEAHILSACERGADGVILWGCENSHREQLESVVTFAQKTLSAFGLGDRVLLMGDAHFDARDFARTLTGFVKKLSPSPLRKKKPGTIDFAKSKRDILLDLIESLSVKTDVHPTLREDNTPFPFAEVSINDSCTLCNACVTMCPTDALSKADNKINFIYGDCIACGLCAHACPEEAIDVKRVLDFSQLVKRERKKLIEAEFVACAECGKLFMPKSAFERMTALLQEGGGEGELNIEERLELLGYCEKCRPVKAVELSLQKLENSK